MPKISIVIITKNRPEKLLACIKSINNNTFKDYEIVVIDQSTVQISEAKNKYANHKKHIQIKVNYQNKSRGLNLGIKRCRSPIIAFTDDDCIVSKTWLQNIFDQFSDLSIDGVFGRTLPYKPNSHQKLFCPSIFNKPKEAIITKPLKHWKYIGFGNNMAFRKNILNDLSGFNLWLGPGTIGMAAEDAEIALRSLLLNKRLKYSPQVLIYHDSWLNSQEYRQKKIAYLCGGVACYTYFYFSGHSFARPIVKEYLQELYINIRTSISFILHRQKKNHAFFMFNLQKIFITLKAIAIAIYLSIFHPIKSK